MSSGGYLGVEQKVWQIFFYRAKYPATYISVVPPTHPLHHFDNSFVPMNFQNTTDLDELKLWLLFRWYHTLPTNESLSFPGFAERRTGI